MNAVATKTVTTKSVSSYDRYFYVNEEGKILNLAPNRRAAQLGVEVTGVLTDVYCGNAVFLGEADAPEELTDLVALHLHNPVVVPEACRSLPERPDMAHPQQLGHIRRP
jgi:hypothetical protein